MKKDEGGKTGDRYTRYRAGIAHLLQNVPERGGGLCYGKHRARTV